jgi:hypothetical protein
VEIIAERVEIASAHGVLLPAIRAVFALCAPHSI